MSLQSVATSLLMASFAVLVFVVLALSIALDARLQEIIRTKAWRGFKFRLLKVYPHFLTVIWGVMPWELSEIVDRARADPRYRRELKLARMLQALYVLLLLLFFVFVILA